MITDVFDAIRDGYYEDFKKYYHGDVREIDPYSKLNLLLMAMVNSKNPADKMKMIQTLLHDGIDINYIDKKYRRNALHTLYFNALDSDVAYLEQVVYTLVSAGIDINAKDIYGAIPLKYALTVCKQTTANMEKQYRYLLKCGSDYKHKDNFGKNCLDYAKELSWRADFIKIAEEVENEN